MVGVPVNNNGRSEPHKMKRTEQGFGLLCCTDKQRTNNLFNERDKNELNLPEGHDSDSCDLCVEYIYFKHS